MCIKEIMWFGNKLVLSYIQSKQIGLNMIMKFEALTN